jgi:hypothetical protein
MDFGAVLAELAATLERGGHRYAVIGGVALAALGLARTTLDLDLVTEAAAQDDAVRWLEERGYETLHRSAGYSNHVHRDPRLGRVDLVYVGGDTAERLFAASRELAGPGGTRIPVPHPEHLVAMKVLAMKNDPGRRFQELADIRFLLRLPGVDREAVRQHFLRHGLLEHYDALAEGF